MPSGDVTYLFKRSPWLQASAWCAPAHLNPELASPFEFTSFCLNHFTSTLPQARDF